MLRFPNVFVADENANDIVKRFMNQRVVDMMQSIISEYCEDNDVLEIAPDDTGFTEYISEFFPTGFTESTMIPIFFGLYELLNGQEEDVPSIAMEYVMNEIITYYIDVHDELGDGSLFKIPEREFVLQKLAETMDEPEDEYDQLPVELLNSFEDLHDYMEWYFWDTDFVLLDTFTEEQIAGSEMNKQLGIIDKQLYTKKFIIPAEWLK